MAPELVKQEPYNSKADIYSWAILSWEILAVSQPYSDLNEPAFMKVKLITFSRIELVVSLGQRVQCSLISYSFPFVVFFLFAMAYFEKKVVMDGERPPLKKTWPEDLRRLLASAWDPDLQKRPSGSKIVAILRIIRCELAQGDRPRTDSRTSAVSMESRICGCEHSPATTLAMSAPARLSHGTRDCGSRESFPVRTTPTSSVRKRFFLSRGRNPSTKHRTSLFGKKRPEPLAGVDAGGSSAADVGALEGMARPAVVRLERRDPAARRAMSLTCTMMRDGSVLVEGQGGERGYIRPRSFSRAASEILETPDEDGDYEEDGPRVEYPVGVLGGVGCPVHHDLLSNRDKIVAMFSQEREGVVEEEPLSRGRDEVECRSPASWIRPSPEPKSVDVELARLGQGRIDGDLKCRDLVVEKDQAAGVSTDATEDETALDVQGGGVQKLWPQPVLPKEDVSTVKGIERRQVRPVVREDAAGDVSAPRVTRNGAPAPIGDLGGRSHPALDDVSDIGLLLRLERENERSLDAKDSRHQLTVSARPLTNSLIDSNVSARAVLLFSRSWCY